MAAERKTKALPPAQPTYILRGHGSHIHSVHFARQNSRLVTGDTDGWIVVWKLETKRALAVWRAHHGAILGSAEWGCDSLITHGRDNTLRIWQMRATDEAVFSTLLPTHNPNEPRPKPWLLHTLPVNTLNFCAFSMCYLEAGDSLSQPQRSSTEPILVAVPARDDKQVEIYQLPDEKLTCVVPRVQPLETGMVMAVKLIHHLTTAALLLLVGYEGGVTAVHKLPQLEDGVAIETAQLVYLSQPHSQPILSIDASPTNNVFFTSSADSMIVVHRVPDVKNSAAKRSNPMMIDSKEVGTSLSTSALDKIISSSVPTKKTGASSPLSSPLDNSPLPLETDSSLHALEKKDPLSDPPPSGLSRSLSAPDKSSLPGDANTFSLSFDKRPHLRSGSSSQPAGLSSMLTTAGSDLRAEFTSPVVTIQLPCRTIDTKHAGQQSVSVRSDGRLLVTGGWDSRIRIYSTKTLKDVAVLKWHKEGVYAVAFSDILTAQDLQKADEKPKPSEDAKWRKTGLIKLQRQREEQIQLRHWVAAGAKDGKVSLWEVF